MEQGMDLGSAIGLVLAGGGAKGAYQVGALRALAELKMPFGAVAGTSIGCLNGAVVAAAPSLEQAVLRLEKVWDNLAAQKPLKLNRLSPHEFIRQARLHLPEWLCDLWEAEPPDQERINDYGVFTNAELMALLREYCPPRALRNGLPLFAALCEHRWWDDPLLALLRCEIGLRDSPDPEFIHVQSLPEDEQMRALLASAAIPLLFAPQMIAGKAYVDGGLASWRQREGNTPLKALLGCGCRKAVVLQLDHDDPWRVPEDDSLYIIEVRPRQSINAHRPFRGILDFDPEHTRQRMAAGYDDAMALIQDLLQLKYMD